MPPARDKPAAEIDIDGELVVALLEEQHEDLSAQTVTPVASGWDNAIFRLGDELAVRLPRRQIAVAGTLLEQRWLPEIAQMVSLSVPDAVRIGRPSSTYPWPWTVVPWFDGSTAGSELLADQERFADDLGTFFLELHVEAPPELESSSIRGCKLALRDDSVRRTVAELGASIDAATAIAIWDHALEVPGWTADPVWVHGDVHPLNLILDKQSNLSAVIDFGDLNAGDPATDLAIAWTAFDAAGRKRFRRACRAARNPVDEATWIRARAWALNFALLYLNNSADVPELRAIGRRALAHITAEAATDLA